MLVSTSFSWLAQLPVISTISWSVAAVSPPYTPTDNFLLNCGSGWSNTTSFGGREWETYFLSNFSTSPDTLNTSIYTSGTSEPSSFVEQIPYSTARIFSSQFTYKFPVSEAGHKFLRLYFYPTNYPNGFDMTTSLFSVSLVDRIILSNFSVFLGLQPEAFTLVKEFIINVNQNHLLEVTFGIEVLSIPDKFTSKEMIVAKMQLECGVEILKKPPAFILMIIWHSIIFTV